jgi:hypothetical protein
MRSIVRVAPRQAQRLLRRKRPGAGKAPLSERCDMKEAMRRSVGDREKRIGLPSSPRLEGVWRSLTG